MLLPHHGLPSFLLPFLHYPATSIVTGHSTVASIGASHGGSARRRYARVATAQQDDNAGASSSSSTSSNPRFQAFTPNRQTNGRTNTDGEADRWMFTSKPNPSPFEVMHLPRTADPSEIKRQYYKLAMLYHPDANHPSSSTDHFAALSKAYNLLSTEASRSLYLRTGIGWSGLAPESASAASWQDDEMRRQARARGRAQYARSYRAESGSGRGGDGYDRMRWGYDAEDIPDMGKGEGRYMSHHRFFASLTLLTMLFGMIQYHRAMEATDVAREFVERKHVGASHALAEAKQEAALYGRQRRDQIRRIVRSMEVEKDYERRLEDAARQKAGAITDFQ